MKARAALWLALGLVAACNQDTSTGIPRIQDGEGDGALTITGHIYGFTAPPDSTRIGVEGVTLSFVRIGDIVEWPDSGVVNPDSNNVPGDTMLTTRGLALRRVFRLDTIPLDTVPTPPGDTIHPPTGNCADGDVAASAVTGSDGAYSVDLNPGIYAVKITPPSASHWASFSVCHYEARAEYDWPFDLYLYPGD